MSVATSMKDLVEDIKVSTHERHAFVKDMTKDVKELIARFDKEQEDLVKELKEMAAEVKKFLAHGEKARKEDFGVMMKDIAARLEDISKWQKDVRKGARELVKDYAADQKKAREYWLSLGGHRKLRRLKKEEKEETK